jgi:hypothetical protein
MFVYNVRFLVKPLHFHALAHARNSQIMPPTFHPNLGGGVSAQGCLVFINYPLPFLSVAQFKDSIFIETFAGSIDFTRVSKFYNT